MKIPEITLKKGREKSVRLKHPWIFASALERVPEGLEPGTTVAIRSGEGEKFGLASFSPDSQIRARMWCWDEGEVIDQAFFRKKDRAGDCFAALDWGVSNHEFLSIDSW